MLLFGTLRWQKVSERSGNPQKGLMGERCSSFDGSDVFPVKNLCENVRCGYGDCVVNLKKHPYYECKCKPPFQGPNCMTRESAAVVTRL